MPDPLPHVPADRDGDRSARELQVLRRAAEEINASLDLEEIYDAALRTMSELFEFHHANILLLDADGDTLRVVASRGYEHQARGGRVKVGVGVIGLVAARRKPLYIGNLGQQRAYAAAQRRQMEKSGRGAELDDAPPVPGLATAESHFAIPLLVRDELVGVFSIESPVQRTFSDHEQSLVTIVASQIATAIHNARLFEERARAVEALLSDVRSRVEGPLLGESSAVRILREAIAREAQRREPLLLVGPPGSGKEAVAHAVHEASRRPGGFIHVNCPELHSTPRPTPRGGAPAQVSEERFLTSRLELAAGGTLFLDAVHELPAPFQAALQRILEGGGETAPGLDVRIVASTSRDMARDAQSGRLDPLFRLLSRHRIAVPALADRRDDIPALVHHFVRRLARQLGKPVTGVSPESMSRLEAYLWPGNIRELRTVLERAIMGSRSSLIEIDDELLDEGLAVGSYRLVSPLGVGGMGEVWLARHRLLARPAAVKLIRQDAGHSVPHDRLVRRFQREAQVTATLRSPHTVQLYDFGINDSGSFYYVMELLTGLDLHRIVTRFGPQPAERVIALMRQACRSLAEAHDRGLVHRDIKPANLFVTCFGPEHDHLKIVDFGIVRDEPSRDITHLSGGNVVQGTPAFMAPELVLGDGRIDGRADLYSLACSAFYVLTGQLVFQAASVAQMILHHAQSAPAAPSAVSELPIPRELDAVILTCLSKAPAERVASALELDARLAGIPLEEPWTQARARAWWETHAPEELVAGSRPLDGPG